MSITNGTHLDLEIIAGILGPEDLDPPLLNRGDHAHPIKVDEETQWVVFITYNTISDTLFKEL